MGSGTSYDYATIKYGPNGTPLWEETVRYNGLGNGDDIAQALAVDALRRVYVTGESTRSGTGQDYATVKYSQCVLQPGDLECILPIEDDDYDLVTGGQRYHRDSHQGIDLQFDPATGDGVEIIAPCDGEVIGVLEQDFGDGLFQWSVAIQHSSGWYIYITFEPHTNVVADNDVQRSWINFPIVQDPPYQNPICIKQGDPLGKLVVRDPRLQDPLACDPGNPDPPPICDWYPHIHWTISETWDFEDAVCPRDKLTSQATQELDWIYGENCLLPVCTDVLDVDFDGITDEIDTDVDREEPIERSNEFSDTDDALGGTTTGIIVDRGNQNLRITDIPSSEPSPNGVLVTSCKYGYPGTVTDAIIKSCNETVTYEIPFGGDPVFIIECGSAITKVIEGTIGILHTADDGRTATVTLNEGNGLEFDNETFAFSAPATNLDTVIILVAGREILLEPGESKIIDGLDIFDIKKARVKLHRKTDKDQFEVKGRFDLAAISGGIDIPSEDVTVSFGEFKETIPAGSFVRKGKAYRYKGPRGAITKMSFFDDGRFDINAKDLDLNVEGFTDPLPFSLTIGDDFGIEKIRFDNKGKFPATDRAMKWWTLG